MLKTLAVEKCFWVQEEQPSVATYVAQVEEGVLYAQDEEQE